MVKGAPVLASLALSLLAACRSTEGEPSPPPPAAPPGYTLVLIKTGPKSGQLSQAENERAFQGHFENMGRLANERRLLVAGPFGEERHDPALRGIFVLATSQRAEAEAWAGTDPTTLAGVFVLEFHDLQTAAPLADALERDIAWRDDQRASGRTPSPGEGARPYVLLTAEHGDLAERELANLSTSDGGVFLLGRLDGSRAFAILDAPDQAGAQERFGPQLEHIGAHTLDEWFASSQLEGLVR